jgi:AcrR family transcriptional regulator
VSQGVTSADREVETGSVDRARDAVTDQRLLRGARARRTIARHAVHLASVEGLTGLSLGRLAADLGISKSGIQTLFGTKERLQLAAVESAREMFLDAVVRPALAAPRGVARLRALVEHWIVYAETPLFRGGCFRAANLAEFDSRPGPVRDALFRDQRDWRALLAGELRAAVDAGEITELDPELTAFQIDAVLCATNTALRLGDPDAVDTLHRVIDGLLTPAAPR